MLQGVKALPASQVKNNFGTIVARVYRGEYPEVVVENHGEPMVAIIPVADLQTMREFRVQKKRGEALDQLRRARGQVQARLKGRMSEEEAILVAEQFSRELIEDLEKDKKIRFERK